ncbi:hypothetical protein BX616_001297 [Lobosporangium transversale]|uniref:Alpha-ketoglutarate-dependent dioxygenase AlkB-like domain-containing protein n=1 Tax=Lobosporangium transversale TaxID=64571 RepID=A0A1Y2GPZ5_9FUNG|nr:hypothetical protein BCR41DRAFT_421594 [Lobosporangium transversale]KAF9904471.1 hypothetical protein BX616_001297 [Lobosporangium transversale]ORZ18359.1 hypothetical protein BCR41DRAFT_421594 [Lobosporangium transversale]|eukprot:XP_021882154.1 hypothetical protein BCR41DRAFT_421594 [Lobosporangium transversale]
MSRIYTLGIRVFSRLSNRAPTPLSSLNEGASFTRMNHVANSNSFPFFLRGNKPSINQFSKIHTIAMPCYHHHSRQFSTQPSILSSQIPPSSPSPSLSTDILNYQKLCTPDHLAATHFDLSRIKDPKERSQILQDFILVPDYLSSTEHDMLVDAAVRKLKRALGKQIRYEDGHFDGVITRYRECSASEWGSSGGAGPGEDALSSTSTSAMARPERTTPLEIMQSIKREFFPLHWHWVSPHILELESEKGGIKPHVDHLDASGEVVAGLCLGSDAVMELIHESDPHHKTFRVLLPKRCFYFQRGQVRYHYKHGIPIDPQDHAFKGKIIPKERRISIMLRNALESSPSHSDKYKM